MYCKNCGANIPDNSNFCPSCGSPSSPMGYTQMNYTRTRPGNPYVTSALAYIPILFWLPLATNTTNNTFGKACANQGLVALIFSFGLSIIRSFFTGLFTNVAMSTWNFGLIGFSGLISTALSLVNFAVFVCCIIGLVKALKGEFFELPIIGKIKIIK